MDAKERKEILKKTFDMVADGYENDALRFFSKSACYMAECFKFKGKEHVLDVATGTGHMALAISKHLPKGKVIGIDFSEGMLSQAKAKADKAGVNNVQFLEMDMQALEFPKEHFDAVSCAFGIFFVEYIAGQLKHIMEKIKPSGKIIISHFHENNFLPLAELFNNRLRKYGVEIPPQTWKQIATEERAASLYKNAGLNDIRVERKNHGYYLKNAEEWWNIVWYAGFRRLVSQLSPTDLEKFKKEHMKEIDALATKEGIWLDVEVLYTIGTKP
ncbi:MAG: class I SAM-dependent methyltransferase [bacterium]|nr:class I SAM-dependent methyltransferase [bacterium]